MVRQSGPGLQPGRQAAWRRAGFGGIAELWDTRDWSEGPVLQRAHPETHPHSIAFSPDGTLLATGGLAASTRAAVGHRDQSGDGDLDLHALSPRAARGSQLDAQSRRSRACWHSLRQRIELCAASGSTRPRPRRVPRSRTAGCIELPRPGVVSAGRANRRATWRMPSKDAGADRVVRVVETWRQGEVVARDVPGSTAETARLPDRAALSPDEKWCAPPRAARTHGLGAAGRPDRRPGNRRHDPGAQRRRGGGGVPGRWSSTLTASSAAWLGSVDALELRGNLKGYARDYRAPGLPEVAATDVGRRNLCPARGPVVSRVPYP